MNNDGIVQSRKKSRDRSLSSADKPRSSPSRRKKCSTIKSAKTANSSDKKPRTRKSADGFDAIFDRVGKMQDAYGFSSYDWGPIEEALEDLRLKHKDKNLYLGIIGEFSSGKSTLINALLGAEILKEDVLQGTTCAPTLLRQGKSFDIEVRLASGKVTRYSKTGRKSGFPKCNDLLETLRHARTFIDKFTAEEEYSKDVLSVTIYLPLENSLFANNIVIVDTPGINADNPRHQEVAEKAIREICDTAIVLTQATMPCSQTLVGFVKDHLSGMTESCICVASQIDLIRRRERDHQLAFVEKKFTTEGARFHKVIGLSAYFAEHPEEKADDPDARLLRQEFTDAQHYITTVLKDARQRVIVGKLKQLLSDVLREKVQPLVKDKTIELQERHERLSNNQLYDFDSYIQRVKDEYPENFLIGDIEKEVKRRIGELADNLKNVIYEVISDSDSKDDVANIFQGVIQDAAQTIQEEDVTSLVRDVMKRHVNQAKEILKGFHDDFNGAFRDLAGERKGTISLRGNAKVFKAKSEFGNFSVSLQTMADNTGAQVGGAAGGAAVGFLVGGPLGALVGGALGWLGSGLFGPSLDEVKKEGYKNANRIVGNWKSSITKSVIKTVLDNAVNVKNRIVEAIDSYSQYREDVLAIISKEKAEQKELESMISRAQGDLEFLANAANLVQGGGREIV